MCFHGQEDRHVKEQPDVEVLRYSEGISFCMDVEVRYLSRKQPKNIRTILGFPLQLSCFFVPAMARGHRLKPGLMLRVAARR